MATVLLGISAPKQQTPGVSVSVNGESDHEDETVEHSHQVVFVDTPDVDLNGKRVPLDKKLGEIRYALSLHSHEEADWVEVVNDESFTQNVADIFDCEVGRPDDWKVDDEPEDTPQTSQEPPAGYVRAGGNLGLPREEKGEEN